MSQRWTKFYLDKDKAWLSGVCAGIARHMDWDLAWVRTGFFLGGMFWPLIFVPAYILAAFFCDELPAQDLDQDLRAMEEAAKPARPGSARKKYASARDRYDRLEERLRALESVVTSKAFQMDRELGR
jgi:phage shock protein C